MGLVVFLDADDIKGKTITTAGYPGTFSNGTQDGRNDDNTARTLYSATGKVDGVESGDLRITYDESVDTQGGQSGSGVWYDGDLFGENVELVAAIHHWGTNNVFQNGGGVNAGVLITKDLYDAFMENIRVDTNGAGAATLPENTIVGTDSFLTFGGNDVIEGTYRKERIIGQGGEDQIRGGGADDRLEGGAGVDQAIFAGEFKDFTYTENADGSYTFTDGNAGDGLDEGTDSLKEFEFAIFEKANASDTEVFIVPLPIEDGPDTKETGDIKSVDGTSTVGAATLEAPAWMFDGDIDYTFTLSGSAIGSLYNFAYIIDKSGSMLGSKLQIAQQAYQTLTQDLISRGVADFSDFVVIPFNSGATSSGTLDAQGAIAAVNALSAGGGTSFTQALSLAESWFNSQTDHQNAINIAFFLSDGQGSGASANLQQLSDGTRVEVRAYGIGNGANLASLNTIDSDNAVLLTNPADLIDEFKKAGVSKDVIDRIEVKLDGVLVDTILPDQLVEDPLGLQITGSISGLEVTRTAKNMVTFDVIFNDGRPMSTVTKEVTTGQEEIIKQTANGTKVVELSVGQTSFLGSVLGAFNSIINGNEVSNQVTDGAQNDQIFTYGGDDIITMSGAGTNLVDGGAGLDVVVYSGTRSSFGSVVKNGGVVKVGTDSLINVEQIQFDDVVIDTATMQESIFATLSPPTVTIDEETSDVARQATFTVTLAKAATTSIGVQFSILGGTATAGTDYSDTSQLVTIAAGQTTASFTVQILNDQEVELDETLLVQADLGAGATFRSGSSVAQSGVVIDDGDIALSVNSIDGFVFEGDSGTTAQLTVSIVRAGDATSAMSVNYAVQGAAPDAADAADFLNGILPSGTVNFAAGQSSVDVVLTIQGDDIVEPTESFEVVLSNPSLSVVSLSGAVFQISNRVQFNGTGNGETVAGNEIDNELFGLDGDDVLEGRLGADILNGGEGTDTATYYRSAQAVTVNMGNGTGTGGEAQGDTLFSIENVTGSAHADILYGNGFANVLSGGGEADRLFGFTGMDVLSGDSGDDRLDGGDDADVLIGGEGTDTAAYTQSAQGVTVNLGNGTGSGGEAQGDTLFGIENVEGSAQADILYGNGFANVLSGGDEADRLFGFTGMDVLSGDRGNDRLEGGDDADVLIGGEGTDTAIYAQSAQGVTVNLGNGTGSGGEAQGDTLFGIENVEGSAQADILYGNGVANVLSGGDEADRLFGFTGMDVLSGDRGNDRLEGGDDADVLIGGEGTDTAAYTQSAQGVTVNLGNGTGSGGEAQGDSLFGIENVEGSAQADILYGNGFANVLSGGDEADRLFGFTGMDVLSGDRGNDRLEGGDDADILIGGDGIDTAIYAQSAQGVTVNLGNGTGTGGEAQGDTLFGIENVEGSAQADILYGNGFANVLSGGDEADRLFGFTGMDVLSGDRGNDRLEGGDDADVLIGGEGTDTAAYTQSAQGVTVNLGNGTGSGGEAQGDTLFGIENVEGSAQADILYGNGVANVLSGGDEADRLFGFTGMDVLSGDRGNDRLEGGDEADVLIGGEGTDTAAYTQSAQGVTINLGNGTGTGGEAEGDTLFGIENVEGSAQADILYGNGFANVLSGGDEADRLFGFTGMDVLYGDRGNDRLEGGDDADILIGGDGTDTAIYAQSAQGVIINLGNGTGTGGEAEGDTLFEIENVDGSNQADILYGNGFANVLSGGDEADRLFGFTGMDVLSGDRGNDRLEGGDEADVLIGGEGTDTAAYTQSAQGVIINLGNGTGSGGEAQGDTLFGIENVDGSSHADILYGNGVANVLSGGDEADRLFGFTGMDVLSGDRGNDRLEGGDDADVLIGGEGTDTAAYTQSAQGVTVNLGNGTGTGGEAEGDTLFGIENVEGSAQADILYGNGFANVLSGGDEADRLFGFTGMDVLYGDRGNDRLEGGDDADILIGGDGTDTAIYAQSAQGVIINLGNGTGSGGEAQGDTLFEIENVDGSNQADILYGNGFANVLSGGDEADRLFGFTGMDVLAGDAGDDSLEGGDDADVLIGGEGIDAAIYHQSAQGVTVNLGNGTGTGGEAEGDTLFGIENVEGSAHADTIYGSGSANGLQGRAGADQLFGFGGEDTINGGDGDDTLDGGDERDILYGENNNDIIIGGAGDDALIGQQGNDRLFGGADNDSMDGGADDDELLGGNGNDYLVGGDGNDSLYGEDGFDTLVGGSGIDTLTGGAGGDTLTGGSGSDFFYFHVGSGVDAITDFEDGIDFLDLTGYTGATGLNTAIAQSGADTVVTFAGSADQVILVGFNATNLTVDADFVFA
jgi:Ca2+-binding RTX toxin-like protein/uncharacterized protein YegL